MFRMVSRVTIAALVIAGCASLQSKPESPALLLTVEGVNLLSYGGCAAFAEARPADVPTALAVLYNDVGPLLERQDPTGALRELTRLDGSMKYAGLVVQLAAQYARQTHLVDTDSTYYALVAGLVGSCQQALAVSTPPQPIPT